MSLNIHELQIIFSNRELAAIIWIFLSILGLQFNRKTRILSGNVVKAFFASRILFVIFLALLYSSLIVFLLHQLNFWDFSLLKDSIYWFIGSAVLIIISLTKANKERDFFKNLLRESLKLVLILEFVVNLHQFGLMTELLLLPIILFLMMIQVVAGREEKTQKVKSLIDWVLVIFGFAMLGISIQHILADFRGFATIPNLGSFLLPIILSISFIPFAYCGAFYMNLELLFIRLSIFVSNKKNLRYAKWQTFLKSKLSLKKLKEISPRINSLYHGSTREDIRNIIT
ncbi:hypothetical protein [Algoriphagus aquimarinus]|uniref:Uncharacterized protein n=1 Tax=Algoriphagus aquimarinus TaxID=237018 RepID=A0A5C7AC93_9BACT|nr:hypothetical protein [Algoriphagus aquimarinus]TXE06410.1 hypothetical protein ESV85_16655 [Algoriphagus aquimarinus]